MGNQDNIAGDSSSSDENIPATFPDPKVEIFILGVSGFSKTARPYPKGSEDVRRFRNMVRIIQNPGYVSLTRPLPSVFPSKIRDFEKSIVIYSFYMDFRFSHFGLSLKVCQLGRNSAQFSRGP